MQKTIVNWLVDRTRLLLTAVLIGALLMGCLYFVGRVLPDPVGVGVSVLVLVIEGIWWVRRCRRRGLSPWTGKPLRSGEATTSLELADLSWEELEGIAAREPGDAP
jgi:hypothetical protein